MKARALALLFLAAGAQAAPGTPSALPPEAEVRRVLASLPALRQGMQNTALAGAERDKLAAGPYEWTVRAGASRRTAPGAERYLEQEVALERPLRWFGKASLDQALGEQGLTVARVLALLQQARQRSEQTLTLLAISYPGLPRPLADSLPLPQAGSEAVDGLAERIVHDNHELQLAQAEADLYAMRASRLASDAMPDPTLALRAARERDGQERVFGVSLSFPLPGAGRAADRSAAAIKASMARERVAQTQLRVALAARRAASDSVHSHAIWTTLQEVQQQTIRQAELMQRAYQAGECTLAEALAGRRQALDAALTAQTAQIEALAAQARLQLDAHAIWSID